MLFSHNVSSASISSVCRCFSKRRCRELTISTAPAPDRLIPVRVADTGAGIDPDVMGKLFQPFVTTKSQGMGVGLSICRTIVEAHGGSISVEANSGGGTIFCVTLPAVSNDELQL